MRAPAEDRLGRLRKVLSRANVSYSHESPDLALSSLPMAMPPTRAIRSQAQKFRFPLAMPARIALFEDGFSVDGAIRHFAPWEIAELKDYVPEALVVSLQFALALAEQKEKHLLDLPALTSAMVILTSLTDVPLQNHHRDVIWHAFGVPLFEQLRGWDGAVIARECEVHDGLHLDEQSVILHVDEQELIATQLTAFEEPIIRVRTGWRGEILREHCECGSETPRLRNLAPLQAKRRFAAAS